MKRLLLAAALAPLSFAAAHAQTTISNATTTPLTTSSSGDITITSAGTVAPATSATAGTVAVTINSNNSVDNEGTITVTESTTGDGSNQGIANGPFANGSDRFGILVAPGGPFTGNITNGPTATITIIGENSAAIAVDSRLNGSLSDTGIITVTGGNANTTDVTYGIFSATGAPISGSVSIAGAITATGSNATGVALNGNVAGGISIDSAITVTGYRSTTPPATEAGQALLGADQLLQSGPAVSIGGSVAGGITLQAVTAASGNVTANAGGTLSEIGSAPALLIGGAAPITVGAAANGYAVTIGGTINAAGTYFGFNGQGIQIGGVNELPVTSGGTAAGGNFSTVMLSGGLDISGSVQATAIANSTGVGGAATGLEIGARATVPRVTVSGTLLAIGSNGLTATGPQPGDVTALKIDQGATVGVTSLNNSGTITAEVDGVAGVPGSTQDAGGLIGNATAISDAGGGLSAITNTGNITAVVVPAIKTNVPIGSSVAIFANNTASLTITQCVAEDAGGNCTSSGNATFTPSITGDIVLTGGTGPQTLNLWGGNITGAIGFGNSTSNVFDIENGGFAKGALTQAAGGELALNVNKGTLFMTSPSLVQLSTLHIGDGGQVIFTGNPGNTTASGFDVAGQATLDNGAAVGLALTTPLTTTETFTVITAGNLTVGNISNAQLGQFPFLVNGVINTTATTVSITATPKSAGELGFNPAQAAMFPAWTAALSSDPELAADMLSKQTKSSFIFAYNQFLPDYPGGIFETLLTGQEEISRAQAEAPVKLQSESVRGWVQEIGYENTEGNTPQVNGYRGLGFGIAGGIERARGDTALGVSAAFVTTGVQNYTQTNNQALSASAFEVGAYWRKGDEQHSGIKANANVNIGFVTYGSQRFFVDTTTANDVEGTPSATVSREAKASWLGGIVSVSGGVGYQFAVGRFFARPEVSADYILATSAGYNEKGGGPAFNLDIAGQTSSQADAQADLVLGMNFGQAIVWRPEVTIGYRAVVYGGPANTVANFEGGQKFTLNPQFTDKGGLLGRVGLRASGQYADFSADAGGEFRNDYQTYDARAAARFLF